jgi:mRNA interferase RelE/StbE
MSKTITIPLEEYQRLLEAAEDLEDLCAVADYHANPQEGVPHAFVVRLIDGENPVAVFRDWRGLSQSELARKSGVNRTQIADIEAGRKTGSVATLKKLAEALRVTIDDLA